MTELSIHFEQTTTEVVGVVNASDREYVLVVNPPSVNVFPGKKVIGRILDEQEQMYVGMGASGATLWWSNNYNRVLAVSNYVYALTTCNEPVNDDKAVIAEYVATWIDLCNRHFPAIKTVAFNFSAGNPEPEDAPIFAETIRKADFVGFHEYWVPEHWANLSAWSGWLMWRYEQFMAHLPTDLQTKPVFITECGCDGMTYKTLGKPNVEYGWQKLYPNMEVYVDHLKQYVYGLDTNVRAAFVFDAGPWSRWERGGYTVTKELAQAIVKLPRTNLTPEPEPVPTGKTIRVKKVDGKVYTMDLEEYVKGVVPYEVYLSWPASILEAQAIAARTYALTSTKHATAGYDVCVTTCCQVYGEGRYNASNQAVENTRGIVGVHKTKNVLVPMYYSASCGGHTLGNWADYLKEVTDCPCAAHGKETSGHQQGLCQWGGYYLSKEGYGWQQILDTYYNLRWVRGYGLGEEVAPTTAEDTFLPHIVEADVWEPAKIINKTRWWTEEARRAYQDKDYARVDRIQLSLIYWLYTREEVLKNE